jgi:hypothetical protein
MREKHEPLVLFSSIAGDTKLFCELIIATAVLDDVNNIHFSFLSPSPITNYWQRIHNLHVNKNCLPPPPKSPQRIRRSFEITINDLKIKNDESRTQNTIIFFFLIMSPIKNRQNCLPLFLCCQVFILSIQTQTLAVGTLCWHSRNTHKHYVKKPAGDRSLPMAKCFFFFPHTLFSPFCRSPNKCQQLVSPQFLDFKSIRGLHDLTHPGTVSLSLSRTRPLLKLKIIHDEKCCPFAQNSFQST